jgi:hypothetical protein
MQLITNNFISSFFLHSFSHSFIRSVKYRRRKSFISMTKNQFL